MISHTWENMANHLNSMFHWMLLQIILDIKTHVVLELDQQEWVLLVLIHLLLYFAWSKTFS